MNKKAYAWVSRLLVNVWPCIQGGGGRVTYIAEDFMHLTVRLPLTWRTRNVVGTIYGGSMYASTDPFFMLMLMRILGKDYVVWDKGCTIRFKRPAKATRYADFVITQPVLDALRESVRERHETEVTWTVQYKDAEGVVHAEFDKVLYVATKSFYNEKLAARVARTAPDAAHAA